MVRDITIEITQRSDNYNQVDPFTEMYDSVQKCSFRKRFSVDIGNLCPDIETNIENVRDIKIHYSTKVKYFRV